MEYEMLCSQNFLKTAYVTMFSSAQNHYETAKMNCSKARFMQQSSIFHHSVFKNFCLEEISGKHKLVSIFIKYNTLQLHSFKI